jgi:hypothetical protein
MEAFFHENNYELLTTTPLLIIKFGGNLFTK